jgi:hypothetical protein
VAVAGRFAVSAESTRQVLLAAPERVELRTAIDPDPAPGAARVRTSVVGVCGSDVHQAVELARRGGTIVRTSGSAHDRREPKTAQGRPQPRCRKRYSCSPVKAASEGLSSPTGCGVAWPVFIS